MKYLALVLFCKDEHEYLEEWLTYHIALGTDHVYLIDNNSRPPLAQSVAELVRAGLVTVLIDGDSTQGRQCRAYARILDCYGYRFQWMGFIDTDEYIVVTTGQRLPAFLAAYENNAALGVFWYCFGSNGHKTRQASVTNAFTKRAIDTFASNNHIKSIVQPRYTWPVPGLNPHCFQYHSGKHCVDEKGVAVVGARRWPRTSELIRINHYITRSESEYASKLRRGGGNSVDIRRKDFIEEDRPLNAVDDTLILGLAARLKTVP